MKKGCRLSRCSLIAALALTAVTAWGQDLINSSPSPVGSGARALGMGGAFIAIADDATAASWNPAGLTQLERPEFSFVYTWKFFQEDFRHTSHIVPLEDTFDADFEDVNFISFVYPLRRTIKGRNLVLSLTYQRKLDFDRTVRIKARDTSTAPPPFGSVSTLFDIDYMQEGGLGTLSPSFGFEITNKLSAGVSVNIWDSDILSNNRWKSRNKFSMQTWIPGFGSILGSGEMNDDFTDYHATNYTIGLLYKPNDQWSIGAVYHTKYTATVRHKQELRSMGTLPPVTIRSSRIRFEWPAAIGLGVAYRFRNDKLTLSMDVTRRDWDDFIKIDRSLGVTAQRVSAVTNLPKNQSPHDPTWTVRLGGEYVFVNERKPKQSFLPSIRAGLFYDPEPASGRKNSFLGIQWKGDGDPDDYYGFGIGGGVLIKNRVNIDVAYQFRWGTNVKQDTFAGDVPFVNNFHADVYQHQLYLSTVVYF